jgi:hypothetical protein
VYTRETATSALRVEGGEKVFLSPFYKGILAVPTAKALRNARTPGGLVIGSEVWSNYAPQVGT